MSNELTTKPDAPRDRPRIDLPVFPVHKVNPDGTLAELTKRQWLQVQTNIARLDGVRAIAHDAMFALADLMANERDRFGDDDRGFGQHLKAHKIEVERNELTAMTSWWRRRTREQRDAAMVYAVEHGIGRMVTLSRHFARLEPSESRTIDVLATVVPHVAKPPDPARPEPAPDWSFADATLSLYGPATLPTGIRLTDLKNGLQLFKGRRWRREVLALVAWVAAHPKILRDGAAEQEVAAEVLLKLAEKLGAK